MSWATEVLWLTSSNLTRYKQKGRSTVLVCFSHGNQHSAAQSCLMATV